MLASVFHSPNTLQFIKKCPSLLLWHSLWNGPYLHLSASINSRIEIFALNKLCSCLPEHIAYMYYQWVLLEWWRGGGRFLLHWLCFVHLHNVSMPYCISLLLLLPVTLGLACVVIWTNVVVFTDTSLGCSHGKKAPVGIAPNYRIPNSIIRV